jgi:hypothetical protein
VQQIRSRSGVFDSGLADVGDTGRSWQDQP